MAAPITKVTGVYKLDTKQAITGLKKVKAAFAKIEKSAVKTQKKTTAAFKKMGKSVGTTGGTLKKMLLPFLSLAGGIMIAKSAIEKFDTQVQAEAQVMQGLKSTNYSAGLSFKELKKQAANFQKNSIFGDETILQNVTAQILTFTNVTKENFKGVQQATLDVTSRLYGAKASGEQLRAISSILGKALNDPVANLGALSRSGIQFSKQQKEVIKKLWETGKKAKAQTLILKELKNQYGGSAAAAAKVGLGPWRQLKNSIGDLMEPIGKFFLIAISGLIELKTFVEQNKIAVIAFFAVLATGMAIYGIWVAWQKRIVIWQLLVAATNPILLMIIGIAALVAGIIYAWKHFETFRKVILSIWKVLKIIIMAYVKFYMTIWRGIKLIGLAFAALYRNSTIFKAIIDGIVTGFWVYVGIIKTIFFAILNFYIMIGKKIVEIFTIAAKGAIDLFKGLFEFINKGMGWLEKFLGKKTKIEVVKKEDKAVKVGGTTKVNDAIITPRGVVETAPDDFIIATKNPGKMGGKGLSIRNMIGTLNINVTGASNVKDSIVSQVDEALDILADRMRVEWGAA